MVLMEETDMQKLDRSQYELVSEPLSEVPFNTLFAQTVVDRMVDGDIIVDDFRNPRTFLIRHPYGMSLLFGNTCNDEFNAWLRDYALNTGKTRKIIEWLQTYPESWNSVFSDLFGNRLIRSTDIKVGNATDVIELNTRINFRFNKDAFDTIRKNIFPCDYEIIRTTQEIFTALEEGVVPRHFWNNADDFVTNGIGFTLMHDGKAASTAFASFICGNQLEIGIQTAEEFRRMGFSRYTGATMINYCIDNGYEPVWSCRLENTGSYKLAQKLGFEVAREIPYYKLRM